MNDTTVTMVGNLVDEPVLRSTDGGHPVASLRVAATARRWDGQAGQHVDGAPLFLTVSCWRALATNVVASLHKGDPVIVTGRLSSRSYDKDGQRRWVYEVDATAVGPNLSRGTTDFTRTPRGAEPERAVGEMVLAGPGHDLAPEPELVAAAG